MPTSHYNRLIDDDENSDDVMLDLNYDNMPLVDNNDNQNPQQIIPTPTISIPYSVITSPSYRNELVNRIIWRTFIISLICGFGLTLISLGFQETYSMKGNNIFNFNIEYSFYYFYIMLCFYGTFIFINLTSLLGIYYYPTIINNHKALIIFQLNAFFFQYSVFLRFSVIILLIVRMMDDTPMASLNILALNQIDIIQLPSYITVKNSIISIFIPKYFQCMIMEFVLYIVYTFYIGDYCGMIKILLA